jgi:hypothetical protein
LDDIDIDSDFYTDLDEIKIHNDDDSVRKRANFRPTEEQMKENIYLTTFDSLCDSKCCKCTLSGDCMDRVRLVAVWKTRKQIWGGRRKSLLNWKKNI